MQKHEALVDISYTCGFPTASVRTLQTLPVSQTTGGVCTGLHSLYLPLRSRVFIKRNEEWHRGDAAADKTVSLKGGCFMISGVYSKRTLIPQR